ncbi:TPA: aspartate carbamoyltransferase [Candidatus Peribacteria bacterium]|nr:MAG: aspartate carbamoyltransferase [Candidatus Peribacteria bacterium RIFOXYC2_FULL_58_10]OGJ84414.1 MAG: aspartate carbamoyltransferase [Candidatus Peribacteria bacterium RIFOXYD2_FULL_58_15]HAI97980.1 aspartate carbamoyltransferase [Candidatus Peribacteria bacterium]HAS34654.1 aspartate carbamoyltransferase [Candidatus Peribacteria bacterium]
MPLPFQHLTSTKQLTRGDTDAILRVAAEMEGVLKKGGSDLLHGKILASLFYEPSTRTRLSFETAMQRLGGQVVTADGLQFSSLYKGESVEDTIKVVNQYADIIAMRHPEQGSADRAASVSAIPFINAGDGPGQHPTQALLDLYTIEKERGKIDGIHITMVGDLKFGRTVHSLSFLLGLYKDIRFTLVSPAELTMPEKVTSFYKEKKIAYTETENLEDGLDADVVYMTRVQKERFEDAAQYERLKLKYILTAQQLKGRSVTVLHPLPRVGEIALDVDPLPTAAYFRQVRNGVVLRMALLAMLLKKA